MIEVLPATADRFADVSAVLGPQDPEAPACWCLSMRVSAGDPRVKGRPGSARAALLRDLCGEEVPPGVLAYEDGEVAGWCAVSPRASFHRLARSRVIPHVDETPVWSVVCFVVRPGFRRRGLAGHLLDGAVQFARQHGASIIEGYPADTGGARIDGAAAYVGTRTLFERHGFAWAADTNAVSGGRPRVVMRRSL